MEFLMKYLHLSSCHGGKMKMVAKWWLAMECVKSDTEVIFVIQVIIYCIKSFFRLRISHFIPGFGQQINERCKDVLPLRASFLISGLVPSSNRENKKEAGNSIISNSNAIFRERFQGYSVQGRSKVVKSSPIPFLLVIRQNNLIQSNSPHSVPTFQFHSLNIPHFLSRQNIPWTKHAPFQLKSSYLSRAIQPLNGTFPVRPILSLWGDICSTLDEKRRGISRSFKQNFRSVYCYTVLAQRSRLM